MKLLLEFWWSKKPASDELYHYTYALKVTSETCSDWQLTLYNLFCD